MKVKMLLMFLLIAIVGCDSEVEETPTNSVQEIISDDAALKSKISAEITDFVKDFGESLECTPSCVPNSVDIKLINLESAVNINYHIDFYQGYVTKFKKNVTFRTGISDYIILDGVVSESEAYKKVFEEIKIKAKKEKNLKMALRSLSKEMYSHQKMADVE
jgi:uncharacterized protein YcfL